MNPSSSVVAFHLIPLKKERGVFSVAYLHHLQLLEPPLHKLLYPPLVRDTPVLAESIFRPPLGVLTEIVEGKLVGVAEERTVLYVNRTDWWSEQVDRLVRIGKKRSRSRSISK